MCVCVVCVWGVCVCVCVYSLIGVCGGRCGVCVWGGRWGVCVWGGRCGMYLKAITDLNTTLDEDFEGNTIL